MRLLITALLFTLPFPALATDKFSFKEYMAEFRKTEQVPSLSYAVIRDGNVVFREALGWRDDEGELASTTDTTYFIASVTKTMAGITFLRAAEEGLVDLGAPMSDTRGWEDFCEWFPASPIVFAGNEELDIAPFSCEPTPTLQQALDMRVNGDPGTAFAYNPLVFARLGRVFPPKGKNSFRSLLRRFVIDAAGMPDASAGWHDPDGKALRLLAPPFKLDDNGRLEKQPFPDDDIRAAAGVYASIDDMVNFNRSLDDGVLLSEEQVKELWTPPVNADGKPSVYSNGWHVQPYRGTTLYWHGGWQPGAYSAIYLKIPEKNLTLIALANTEALYWNNPITTAEIHKSEVVQAFFRSFAPELADQD